MQSPPGTQDFTATFHVPADFPANGTAQVIVHFVTNNAGVFLGNVAMQLNSLFTPVGGLVTASLTSSVVTVNGVTNSFSAVTYNHYDAVFNLSQPIGPEDLALLDVTRASGDTFNGPVYLTSIEFRAVPPAPSVTLGNHSFNQAVNVPSVTSTPMSVSSGSSVYVALSVGAVQTVTSVTDNQAHTYTKAVSTSSGAIETEIWYTDNVSASASLTVTAAFTGSSSATIEAAEIQGTSHPSLDQTAGSTGHSLVAGATVSSSAVNEFALLSVVTANNGAESFTAVAPDLLIDASPVPAPGGQNVAGADLGETLTNASAYSLSANITGHASSPVDWAAAAVSIH